MAPSFSLNGKTAVVIGGTGVLGGVMAEALSCAGASVVIAGRDGKKAQPLLDRIASEGCPACFLECDVSDRRQHEQLLSNTLAEYGAVDVLVNGAGINAATPFLEIEEEEIDRILTINFKAVFFACQVFGQYFLEHQRAASIINIGSVSGVNPLSRVFTYSSSKAAVHNLTRNLAREWAEQGVRVNTLVPGFFPAEQNRKVLTPDRVESIMRQTPAKRFGKPEELVGALLLLASEAGQFITGTELVVDGGFCATSI